MSEGDRVLIPSVVSPARELVLAELSQTNGYLVEIENLNSGERNKYFVGELAVKEGSEATFTLDSKKHLHPNHDILVFTTAALLNIPEGATVVAGLPISYFSAQKAELKSHLERLNALVSVNGGPKKRISFGRAIIYPQGAGALLMADLPESGTVLLVDPGQKTTDYVTAEIRDGMARPISAQCGSVELGVFDLHVAIATEFQSLTGSPLPVSKAPEILRDGSIFYMGKEYDFRSVIVKAKKDVSRKIADQIKANLKASFGFNRRTYLVGGGAECLPLTEGFPGAEIIPEPRWANAFGFLSVGLQS